MRRRTHQFSNRLDLCFRYRAWAPTLLHKPKHSRRFQNLNFSAQRRPHERITGKQRQLDDFSPVFPSMPDTVRRKKRLETPRGQIFRRRSLMLMLGINRVPSERCRLTVYNQLRCHGGDTAPPCGPQFRFLSGRQIQFSKLPTCTLEPTIAAQSTPRFVHRSPILPFRGFFQGQGVKRAVRTKFIRKVSAAF
jgi:hypothetical protein